MRIPVDFKGSFQEWRSRMKKPYEEAVNVHIRFPFESTNLTTARILKLKIILFTLSTHYILLPSILQVPVVWYKIQSFKVSFTIKMHLGVLQKRIRNLSLPESWKILGYICISTNQAVAVRYIFIDLFIKIWLLKKRILGHVNEIPVKVDIE